MGAHFIETNLKNTIFFYLLLLFLVFILFKLGFLRCEQDEVLDGYAAKKKKESGGAQMENNTGNL